MPSSRVAWAVLLAALFVLQAATIVQRAGREPHVDETEYLHAAWLLEQGERLYATFFEHHPPFLFGALQLVAGDDVPQFFFRARLLSGAFALAALGMVAFLVWRVRPEAAVIATALMFASQPLWQNGLVAARVEPFALAFFWAGALLVLTADGDTARGSLATGLGVGLVTVAGLWSPKWPFSSVLVAAFWWMRTRYRTRSATVAAALAGAGVAMLTLFAPLGAIWFFNVEFNRAFWPILARSPEILEKDFQGATLFLYAPVLLPPVVAAAAFTIVTAAAFGRQFARQRTVIFLLLLLVASLAELRFVFPWPALWHHYYLMWAFAAASLVGLVPAALTTLLRRLRFRWPAVMGASTAVVLTILAGAQIVATIPLGVANSGPYWLTQAYIEKNLAPGETVWMDMLRHPVNARDESYYWFGRFEEMALLLRSDGRGARFMPPPRDFPFCDVLGGSGTRVRFISVSRFQSPPPEQLRCFEQLLARGGVRATPFASVYEFPADARRKVR